MQRTIRINLPSTPAQANALLATRCQLIDVFDTVVGQGWQQRIDNNVMLHRALYCPLKASPPDLVSDMHTQARNTSPLENLTHGCQRPKQRAHTPRLLHGWPYHRMGRFLRYKAEARDWMVLAVKTPHSDPHRRCGYRHASISAQHVFTWHQDWYGLSADLNTSYNIAPKHHASIGSADAGVMSVTQPIAAADLRV